MSSNCSTLFVLLTLGVLTPHPFASAQHTTERLLPADTPRYALHTTPAALATIRRVWVRVEVLDPALSRKVLPPYTLQADVEKELRQAGVMVVTSAQAAKTGFDAPLLEIRVDTNSGSASGVEDWYGYCVAARLREGVLLARSPKEGVIGAVTWEQREVGLVAADELSSLRNEVYEVVRRFLVDYQKTHRGVHAPAERTAARKTPDA